MAVLKRVGFVGIGRMGYPMAGHIVEAGFDVTVSDMDKEPVDRFVENYNANSAENLTALSRDVDVIITMLPTSKIVREVVLGDGKGDCLHRGLTRGQILIDASTSNPITTQEIGKELEKDGIEMIDAPVAGGVVFAVNGTLDVMVGGNQETINRCKPLFEAIGGNTVYCGSLGSGHAVKVLNNFVNASTLISLIEALVLGCKFGLDINMMVESMMAATTGRNHPIQKKTN